MSAGFVIYTTRFCGYCVRARQLLERKGIAFREIYVDGDAAMREEMVTRSGGRRTVPQIFFGDRHIGGCDDLYALDRSGGIEALIPAAQAPIDP